MFVLFCFVLFGYFCFLVLVFVCLEGFCLFVYGVLFFVLVWGFFFPFETVFLFKSSCMSKSMMKYTSVMVTLKGHLEQYKLYLYMYKFFKIQTRTT